jgi:hypothetical protein
MSANTSDTRVTRVEKGDKATDSMASPDEVFLSTLEVSRLHLDLL